MNSIDKASLKHILGKIAETLNENKDYLIELDAAMGDGDLGLTMSTGFKVLYNEIDNIDSNDLGMVLMKLGMIMNNNVPSTMGTLMSICLIKGSKEAKGKNNLHLDDLVNIGRAAIAGVQERAGTKIGDKTMLDALYPAVEALSKSFDNNLSLKDAFKRAFDAALNGAEKTKELKSTHGRAAYYGDNSIGKPDPGAYAVMFIFKGMYLSME